MCTLCFMLWLFYIRFRCVVQVSIFLSENKEKKRKREKEKGLLMCVISKDQSWGVERGHIISSSKCSSTERHIRHLPTTAKREQLWAEREYQHVSVWGKRKLLCLKVLLDDWSSAVVKNRLLQQLLHRLLSLACSASPLSQSLSLTHTHTHDTACFQPTASSVASFPFSSLSLR